MKIIKNTPLLKILDLGLGKKKRPGTIGLDYSVKSHYQKLIDGGIIYLDSISAAKKVNEIWNNIDSWCNRYLIQDPHKRFCDNFVVANETHIQNLKMILEEISSE